MKKMLRSMLANVKEACMFKLYEYQMLFSMKNAYRSNKGYFDTQFRRTFGKRNSTLPIHAQRLILLFSEIYDFSGSKILCVGCRNGAEIDYFRQLGARNVQGIDIFSVRSDILIMDMHQMTFPDHFFDVLYSAHSFEHALHPERAAREFIRVVRPGGMVVVEVPVNFVPYKADLHDYRTTDILLNFFRPYVGTVHVATYLQAGSNGLGTDTIQVIFRVQQ